MTPERIEDIVAFVRAADARSFTVAAQHLGLSRSTVGKRITRLEQRLGVRLLHRSTRSVTLTNEGEVFLEQCLRILQDLEDAESAMTARSGVPRGRLRLDVPVSLGRMHILPVAHRYMNAWPDVQVSVSFADRYVDLIEEGVDLAIRIGGASDSRLIARTLAPHDLVTCASPDYLSANGVPRTLEELTQHSCLAFTHMGRPVEWRFTDDGQRRTVPVEGRINASNAEALKDAALAGFGIAQLATFLIGDELRTGRLVRVLDSFATAGEPIRAVYPSRRLLSPKVKAFLDMLTDAWEPCLPWSGTDGQRATLL